MVCSWKIINKLINFLVYIRFSLLFYEELYNYHKIIFLNQLISNWYNLHKPVA